MVRSLAKFPQDSVRPEFQFKISVSTLLGLGEGEMESSFLIFAFHFLFQCISSYMEGFLANILKACLQAFSLISITIIIHITVVGQEKSSSDSCYFGCQYCQKELKLSFSLSFSYGLFFLSPVLQENCPFIYFCSIWEWQLILKCQTIICFFGCYHLLQRG